MSALITLLERSGVLTRSDLIEENKKLQAQCSQSGRPLMQLSANPLT